MDELALPDEEVTWIVDKVFPSGGNVLLTAAYKTGKTTLVGHLAKCLADFEPFLNRFPVSPGERVALWNYEVSAGQYRRWLREVEFAQPASVSIAHLRGQTVPLLVPHVQDWAVRWLADRQVTTWVVDPFARAFVGSGDENSNSDVGAFLDALDVIKDRAGVHQLVLPAHTGRMAHEEGKERARGATRLNDWADVQWLLTRNDDGLRFFAAAGRDVDVPEEQLTFDEARRSLSIGGWDRRTERVRRIGREVVEFVRAHPGCPARAIEDSLNYGRPDVDAARRAAIREGEIHVVTTGAKKEHYVGSGIGLP